jgi:hypothetical protein
LAAESLQPTEIGRERRREREREGEGEREREREGGKERERERRGKALISGHWYNVIAYNT